MNDDLNFHGFDPPPPHHSPQWFFIYSCDVPSSKIAFSKQHPYSKYSLLKGSSSESRFTGAQSRQRTPVLVYLE